MPEIHVKNVVRCNECPDSYPCLTLVEMQGHEIIRVHGGQADYILYNGVVYSMNGEFFFPEIDREKMSWVRWKLWPDERFDKRNHEDQVHAYFFRDKSSILL